MSDLESVIARARDWLFNAAFPLWLGRGFDQRTGLFEEQLMPTTGDPVPAPRRLRVQARQLYVCVEAARLGWAGDWRTPLEAGVRTLIERGRKSGGGFIHQFDPNGGILDVRCDLYDHAFALFALANAMSLIDDRRILGAVRDEWAWLDARWRHPQGGYREGEIASSDLRRQNPHMHLLEAALVWASVAPAEAGLARADEIARLFRTRFFDEAHGALPEYFDEAWNPLPDDRGRITEPGHHFEWSWLLRRLKALGGQADIEDVPERLIAHARRFGVDAARGVAINEVWIDGRPKDGNARLWPQTERLKAGLGDLRAADPKLQAAAEAECAAALEGLLLYCATPCPGSWRDVLGADGVFVEQPAPASSFYHIVCALAELDRELGRTAAAA